MVRRTARKAFTLIELLLVLVILAVLAAVVIPKLTGRVAESKGRATIGQISNLKAALESYEQDNDKYPDASEGLEALVSKPASASDKWHKLLDEVPMDGWGHPFSYVINDDGSYNIISGGLNGSIGDDDDIDIYTKDVK